MNIFDPNSSRIVIGSPHYRCAPFSVAGTNLYNPGMPRVAFALLALSFAVLSCAAEPVPVLDNDRLSVFDSMQALPPAQHDFVVVSLTLPGSAYFGHRSEVPGKPGERTHSELLVRGHARAIITELK